MRGAQRAPQAVMERSKSRGFPEVLPRGFYVLDGKDTRYIGIHGISGYMVYRDTRYIGVAITSILT